MGGVHQVSCACQHRNALRRLDCMQPMGRFCHSEAMYHRLYASCFGRWYPLAKVADVGAHSCGISRHGDHGAVEHNFLGRPNSCLVHGESLGISAAPGSVPYLRATVKTENRLEQPLMLSFNIVHAYCPPSRFVLVCRGGDHERRHRNGSRDVRPSRGRGGRDQRRPVDGHQGHAGGAYL